MYIIYNIYIINNIYITLCVSYIYIYMYNVFNIYDYIWYIYIYIYIYIYVYIYLYKKQDIYFVTNYITVSSKPSKSSEVRKKLRYTLPSAILLFYHRLMKY